MGVDASLTCYLGWKIPCDVFEGAVKEKATKILKKIHDLTCGFDEIDDTVLHKIGNFELTVCISTGTSYQYDPLYAYFGVNYVNHGEEVDIPIDVIAKFYELRHTHIGEWYDLRKTIEHMILYKEPSIHAFAILS